MQLYFVCIKQTPESTPAPIHQEPLYLEDANALAFEAEMVLQSGNTEPAIAENNVYHVIEAEKVTFLPLESKPLPEDAFVKTDVVDVPVESPIQQHLWQGATIS